jgi:hypothetical protein
MLLENIKMRKCYCWKGLRSRKVVAGVENIKIERCCCWKILRSKQPLILKNTVGKVVGRLVGTVVVFLKSFILNRGISNWTIHKNELGRPGTDRTNEGN